MAVFVYQSLERQLYGANPNIDEKHEFIVNNEADIGRLALLNMTKYPQEGYLMQQLLNTDQNVN